jgi:hypothetical protein
MEKGNIEIHSENIFPIIKKWLYSDRDIFVRELISNGCDAVTKLKKLISLGEYTLDEPEWKITVRCDEAAGTLSFSDNGIGMTAEEVQLHQPGRLLQRRGISGAVQGRIRQRSDHRPFRVGLLLGLYGLQEGCHRHAVMAAGPEAVRWT